MTLRLYNTLTRQKEDFAPLDPANVRMYVCGPTVYDYAHIGNARPAIVFDVLFRLLRHLYGAGHVTYVRNTTDIDDKINARALELRGNRNVDMLEVVRELTERTYGVYQSDVEALGCLKPTFMPRATEHVPQMIAMIRTLIDAGLAYEAEGHVLFDVAKKPDYGKLSRRPLDEMIAGARVDVAPYKREAMDFVLWKPSDANTPGWDSPWGRGRPGWHLECSSMIEATMGETIDIHGGGIDLVFPHHENEIAQSEGAHHGHPLARFWMHNGFLNVEGEKMSKSLGNFVTIREILRNWNGRGWSGAAVRLAMFRTHYTQPLNWNHQTLEEASWELSNWAAAISSSASQSDVDPESIAAEPSSEILDALNNDLNTPLMLKVLRDEFGRAKELPAEMERFVGTLKFLGVFNPQKLPAYIWGGGSKGDVSMDAVFGNMGSIESLKAAVLNDDVESEHRLTQQLEERGFNVANNSGHITLTRRYPSEDSAAILAKIEARNAARKAKNFKESDRIRDELLAQGIQLKDGPDGTTWEVKR